MKSAPGLLRRTPDAILGPFYPIASETPAEVDLTAGYPDTDGERIGLEGWVVDIHDAAISGATVEIWHANAAGRYAHPNDLTLRHPQPVFMGHGRQFSDSRGRFAFVTIRPGPYPLEDGTVRSAHIHFQVTTRCERLVTQMFFPDVQHNRSDPALDRTRRSAALTASWVAGMKECGVRRIARWTIVMTSG